MAEPEADSAATEGDGRLSSFLELLALCGLVVAQPVLSSFGDSPETFVGYDAGTLDVLAFAAVVVLVPPLVLWLVEQLVGLAGRRPRRWVHLLAVFALVTGFAIQVGKDLTELGYKRLFLLAAAIAVLTTVVYACVGVARLFVRFLAVAPVAFALLFLVASPVTAVAFPGDGADVTEGIEVGAPAPVVMVVLDELPTASLLDAEGRIDRRSYPNLARFADDATWYRNHTTVAQETEKAVPALLTGRVPERGRIAPIASEYDRNLFTLLEETYDVRVLEQVTQLCPGCRAGEAGRTKAALPKLLTDAFELWRGQAAPKRTGGQLGPGALGAFQEGATTSVRNMGEFIRSLDRSRSSPRLDLVHLLLPHGAWRFLPSGALHNGDVAGAAFGVWPDQASADVARHGHLLQLRYTDQLLGRLFDRLRDLGSYDESLVVVTADHGIAFEGGERVRAATDKTFAEVAWAPLFVKAPGQRRGERIDAPARSVDILPTIADHLDVNVPWELDGSSLLEPGPPGERVELVAADNFLFGEQDEDPSFDRGEGFEQVLGGAPPYAEGQRLRAYRLGPYGALVGRSVEELPVAQPSDFSGRLDDPDAFDGVDLDDGEVLPTYVAGELDNGRPGEIVVSVNGVVGGWARLSQPHAGADELRRRDLDVDLPENAEELFTFEVLVPPALLEKGDNEIEVFLLEGGPEDARLMPIDLED